MKRMLQKSWVLTSITLLGMTSTVPPVNVAVAETIQETETSEGESLKLPHDNLLETLDLEGASTESEEANVEKGPTFSFEQEEMSGTVGEITEVIILVDQPISQVEVTIPKELIVELEELSEEIEAIQMNEQEWWFAAEDHTGFVLPISSETAGQYTLRIEDEIDGTIVFLEQPEEDESEDLLTPELQEIEEPSELPEDVEPTEDNERDTNNEPEDSLTREVQEEEKVSSQESEEVALATTSNVSTWAQFRTAINTNSVTVINVHANISGNTSLNTINRDLTINGNGFTINSQSQHIYVQGANRQITIRNATIRNTNTNSLFISVGDSDIVYRLTNVTLGGLGSVIFNRTVTVDRHGKFSYIFDGGTNILEQGTHEAIFGYSSIEIINNARVICHRPLAIFQPQITESVLGLVNVTVEEGSSLFIKNSGGHRASLATQNFNIYGDVHIETDDTDFNNPTFGSFTGKLTLSQGEKSQLTIGHNSVSPLLTEDIHTLNMNIVYGAKFDISNMQGNSLLNNIANTNIQLQTENLAVWNRGRVTSSPSNNFENLEAYLTDADASMVTSANHNAFRSTYSKQGLAGYSRISSSGMAGKNPVDPLEPEIEIEPDNPPVIPENQGNFRIDFVSQFSFGSQEINRFEESTYYALPQYKLDINGDVLENEPKPNYVQITDNRSDSDNWQLSVRQKEQFKTEEGSELSGASLQLMNRQLVSNHDGQPPREATTDEKIVLEPGVKQPLLSSSNGEGKGTWIYRFGDGDSASQSIALIVPKETIPQATTYQTILDWELQAVPDNN